VKETVTVLKVMAGAISTELDDQAELLEDFEGELDSSQAKLMRVMNKLDKTLAITKGAFVFVCAAPRMRDHPSHPQYFLCEREGESDEGLVDSSHTARVAVHLRDGEGLVDSSHTARVVRVRDWLT
jgi:hypothetical protein